MNALRIVVAFFVVMAVVTVSLAQSPEEVAGKAAAQEGKCREALAQYTAALQKTLEGSADDQRLRETIIKLVQKLSPPPGLPEEARRFSVRGQTWIKEATNPSDFEQAAKEFGTSLRFAPWWADGYINHAVALEKAGRFSDSIRSLKLYLLAAPSASDAENVKAQIYALEVRQEKTAKEKTVRGAVVERQREEQLKEQRWLDGVNGARFSLQLGPWPASSMRFTYTIDIRGKEVVLGEIAYYGSDVRYNYPSGEWVERGRTTLKGHEFIEPSSGNRGIVSEDGNSVNVAPKSGMPLIYRRQR